MKRLDTELLLIVDKVLAQAKIKRHVALRLPSFGVPRIVARIVAQTACWRSFLTALAEP